MSSPALSCRRRAWVACGSRRRSRARCLGMAADALVPYSFRVIWLLDGPRTRGLEWMTWLRTDLGERALWVETARRAAVFAGATVPELIIAGAEEIAAFRA